MTMEKSSVHRIVAGVKRYLGLQREYVMLSFVEKLTILLTALFVWGVVMLILLLCLLFASLSVSSWISELMGSEPLGYAFMALVLLLLCLLIYANRKRWIAGPIASFLVAALLSDKDKDSDD